MTERIPPTNDLVFKKTFSEESNKDILQGIIGDFFDFRPALDDITITAPYSVKAYGEYLRRIGAREEVGERLRQTVQDIAADFKVAGFGAELQLKRDDYFSERSLYYVCDRFCSNYNRMGRMAYTLDGRPIRYSSLKPVYALNILGYPHFPGDDDALRVFTLYDRRRLRAFETEYLTVAYFELAKDRVETANQRHWRAYFTSGVAPDDAPEYIKKAARVIDKANLTQEEREMIDQIQRAKDIYASEIHTAEQEGLRKGLGIGKAEGKAEGIGIGRTEGIGIGRTEGIGIGKAEERVAIARKMLARGRPMDEVVECTGLTRDEIGKLAQ